MRNIKINTTTSILLLLLVQITYANTITVTSLDSAVNSTNSGMIIDQRGLNRDNSQDIGAFGNISDEEACTLLGLNSNVEFTETVSSSQSLINFILCANANSNTLDVINLDSDITYSTYYEDHNFYGKSALPIIDSPIELNGMGFALQRDSNLGCDDLTLESTKFRLINIQGGGNASINDLTILNGCLDMNSTSIKSFGAGALINNGTLNIVDSKISNNKGALGGGINIFNGSISNILNTEFTNNSARSGGALYNINGQINSIENSLFKNNNSEVSAGAIGNDANILSINNTLFSENKTNTFGGAIDNRGTITSITHSMFHTNESLFHAGGIFNDDGEIHISNSTFAGNIASFSGGAINFQNSSSVSINNSTFSTNQANQAGAIFSIGSVLSLSNNLFLDNTDDEEIGHYSDCYLASSGMINGSNNLSNQSDNNCGVFNIDLLTDSTIGALTDNGCTTPIADGSCIQTHALLPNSEALDGAVLGTQLDQRGYTVLGDRDIGAFEAFVPQITLSITNDVIMEATGPTTAVEIGDAIASDPDEIILNLIPIVDNNSPFTVGEHVLTWSATDSYGHTGTASRTITITDTTIPEITLAGNNPLILNQGDSYIDPTAFAIDIVDEIVQISGTGSVDSSIVGQYQIAYNYTDNAGNAAAEVIRTVHVIDVTAPVITLIGDNPLLVDLGSEFSDPGATVTDNVDSIIQITGTGLIDTTTVGTYQLAYNHSDKGGNSAIEKVRTVIVEAADLIYRNGFEELTIIELIQSIPNALDGELHRPIYDEELKIIYFFNYELFISSETNPILWMQDVLAISQPFQDWDADGILNEADVTPFGRH